MWGGRVMCVEGGGPVCFACLCVSIYVVVCGSIFIYLFFADGSIQVYVCVCVCACMVHARIYVCVRVCVSVCV